MGRCHLIMTRSWMVGSLKLYNTEDTNDLPYFSQTVVGNTYKIRFTAFVQAKNTRVEYRQDSSKQHLIALQNGR